MKIKKTAAILASCFLITSMSALVSSAYEGTENVWVHVPLDNQYKATGSGTKDSPSIILLESDSDYTDWNLYYPAGFESVCTPGERIDYPYSFYDLVQGKEYFIHFEDSDFTDTEWEDFSTQIINQATSKGYTAYIGSPVSSVTGRNITFYIRNGMTQYDDKITWKTMHDWILGDNSNTVFKLLATDDETVNGELIYSWTIDPEDFPEFTGTMCYTPGYLYIACTGDVHDDKLGEYFFQTEPEEEDAVNLSFLLHSRWFGKSMIEYNLERARGDLFSDNSVVEISYVDGSCDGDTMHGGVFLPNIQKTEKTWLEPFEYQSYIPKTGLWLKQDGYIYKSTEAESDPYLNETTIFKTMTTKLDNGIVNFPITHGGDYTVKVINSPSSSCRMQLASPATKKSEKTDIRFVASLNSQNYSECGFYIDVNGKTIKQPVKNLYTSVIADGKTLNPSDVADDKNDYSYSFAFALKNISKEYYNTPIKVRTYAVTSTGNEIVSGEKEYVISDYLK